MFRNVLKKELVVRAQMSNLKAIRDFIEEIGHLHRFSDRVVNSFKLVIDEAVTNIIRHGYRDVPDGKIKIRAIVRRYSLTMVVIDQGITFDPRQAKNPDLKKYIDIGKKGGLGILMMRKLMDDIQYSLTPEGNELRLTKKREAVRGTRFGMIWDNLSMQARFTAIASLVTIVLGIVALSMYTINSQLEVERTVLESAAKKCQDYASISYESLIRGNNLQTYAISKTMYENSPEMVNDAFLVDNDTMVISNSLSRKTVEKIGKYQWQNTSVFVDSIKDVAVYKLRVADSLDVFDLRMKIKSLENDDFGGTLATAHIWVTNNYIDEQQISSNIRGILIILIITSIVTLLVFFLIKRIINPFSQLADWVRTVGSGKVDHEEFEIDSSDELGEIAQAFSEMTTKFREAQVGLIEQQRLQKELQVAQEIQHMLLPQDFPQVKGYELSSYYEAAKEVGGDLFDFVDVDEDTLGICVADVSGKGVPGSMIMTMIRTALRLEARGNKNAADVLARVNRFVTSDMRKGMFVTIFYVVLDSRNRVISYASAGHNPMILYRASTQQTYYLNPQGFPVGISLPDIRLFDKTIENDRINLRSDDILIIYTDGVTEAMNSRRELFSDERFLEVIRANGHLPVQDFVRNCRDSITSFTSGFQQNDDITIVAIKEKMSANEVRVDVQKRLFQMVDEENIPVAEACQVLRVSPFTYYKYRPIVDKYGFDGLSKRLHKKDDIELRHLAIEVKAKIFDIIRGDPEVSIEKISEILGTEKYGFLKIRPEIIKEELTRIKLDTLEKRKRFVAKSTDRKALKSPGTPLLTLDGQVIKNYQGTDTFSPIYQPKKRVFTDLEDKPDEEPKEYADSVPEPTEAGVERSAITPVDKVDKVELPKEDDLSQKKVDIDLDHRKLNQSKTQNVSDPVLEHNLDETKDVPDDLKIKTTEQSKTEISQPEKVATKATTAKVKEQKEQSVDVTPVKKADSQADQLLSSFEDDKEEKEDIEFINTELLLSDEKIDIVTEDESDNAIDEHTHKSKKRIKSYSEIDSDSKSVYVDFYNKEKERVDKLDFLIHGEDAGEDIFIVLGEHLSYFVDTYGKDKQLKRLIQLFKQVLEIIAVSDKDYDEKNKEHGLLLSECLKFITKKNILAEDLAKIRILNEIGILKNKIKKQSGGNSRNRPQRRRSALANTHRR